MRHALTEAELARIESLSLEDGFRDRIRAILAEINDLAAAEPWHVTIAYGRRTHAEQAALYSIGRRGKPGEKPVTKAQPGQSPHNHGLAADLPLIVDAGGRLGDRKAGMWIPDNHDGWAQLERIAVAHGLASGNGWRFRDAAHVEHPRWRELAAGPTGAIRPPGSGVPPGEW